MRLNKPPRSGDDEDERPSANDRQVDDNSGMMTDDEEFMADTGLGFDGSWVVPTID